MSTIYGNPISIMSHVATEIIIPMLTNTSASAAIPFTRV